MIVIGADTYKRTRQLAAVDGSTGQLLGGREIVAADGAVPSRGAPGR